MEGEVFSSRDLSSADMNSTPRSVRTHIAFFGRSNAGKSSLINALTGQDIAIVSPMKGTTTDPVFKSMEILPLGPCEIIDTAGFDDNTEIAELRIARTLTVLDKTDIAILVADGEYGINEIEEEMIYKIKLKKIPFIIAFNKADIMAECDVKNLERKFNVKVIPVSAVLKIGINSLKAAIAGFADNREDSFRIVGDIVNPGDIVVLVTPIDKAAPKGRLILPQQQVIRDVLESDAICVVTKEHELKDALEALGRKPRIVITDSQVFLKVSADTPPDIMLTSFSILFARYKGDLNGLVQGAGSISKLKNGDRVLIAEGCTHHRQSDDIGTVKIPRWLRQLTGKEIVFEHSAGYTFSDDLKKYALIVHCGGCMLNAREMRTRLAKASAAGVPVVNYGVLIAYVQGILDRVLEPFPLAKLLWEESQGRED